MKLFHGPIRKKLIFLVLLATTPAMVVLLGIELVNKHHAVTEAEKDAALFLHGFTEVQRRITDSTRTLLRTVASIPDIRNANIEKSRVILTTLLETNPIYTNVILIDLDGNVVAAGKNHERAIKLNFSDRKQFKEAIASKGFASGEFVVGKSSNKPIFPFGTAVLDEKSNKAKGAIIIGVSLSHYGELFERGDYPEGTFFGLSDHQGIRLFRYPLLETVTIGRPIKKEVYKAASNTNGTGSIIAMATDGIKRMIVFEPLHLKDSEEPYIYMFMGSDYELIQTQANNILVRMTVTGLSSLIIALAIAWFIGGRSIACRLENLTLMTRKFSQDNKNVASDIDYSDGEVGDLAKAFDNMVVMLHQREDERNLALKRLSTSEQRFREIFEDVSEIAIQGYNEQRKVTFWNSASENLYGYTREEALGKKLEDLIIPPEMKEDVIQLHTQWLESNKKIPGGELVLVDKSGSAVPIFSSHIISDTHYGKELFCIDIDLRPLKESEANRKQLITRLKQAQKMEAIGTLAGGIAHDFNNILFPILGYTEILMETVDGDELTKDRLSQIHSSTLRAQELVRQILTFSRQESTKYKQIKIQPILKEVTKLLRSTIPQNIEIKKSIDPDCKAVHADATQIHQIIMNLATNAYHAMGNAGGELNIHLYEQTIEPADSKNLGIRPGNTVCLVVSDTGAGMPPELVEKIFDPFFTTKEKGQGTGMGLSVVHGIVEKMNGCIDISSIPGQGSKFRLYFPVDDKPAQNYEKDDRRYPSSFSGTERILVVDDDDAILRMVKQALEIQGYSVKSEDDPLAALEIFRSSPEEFDLVITDVSMPGMSGDELATNLFTIRKHIPVLLCTGFSDKVTPESAKNMGIKEILMKPLLLEELYSKVRTTLDEAGNPD